MVTPEDIANSIKLPLTDPRFLPNIFKVLAKQRRQTANNKLERIMLEDYDEISRRLDRSKIQESVSVRNILRTRRLATMLIDDKGELNKDLVVQAINILKDNLYSLGPDRQFDAKRQEQILRVLQGLQTKKELYLLLKKISKPFSHKHAEQLIRDTLQLPANTIINDAMTRRAVLSAWLTTLRQNVGSCFATAPAIIIHDEQPELFLKDLNDLLSTGRLTRTFGGVEYSVPLCPSWGVGDTRKVFPIPRDLQTTDFLIWQSPGFLQALEDIGLVDSSLSLKQKVYKVRELLISIMKKWEGKEQIVMGSVEDIFKRLLMDNLGLRKQDLEDYENRPRTMLYSSLMIQVPKSAVGSGGKGEASSHFYQLLELANNTFKGFADNALLKSWEFTLASFSESKASFARWNLYSSLGLGPDEAGGIGNYIFTEIKVHLDQTNAKVQEMQFEYEQVYSQLKYMESRVKHASEREAQWLRAEYQAKANEFYTLEEVRDKIHAKARRLASMYDVLIELYDAKFPVYFQEVYDPDMHDVQVGPYDDSPAGFRLLFKHGRSNTSQWTPIKNANEFTDALSTFFTATENEITSDDRLAGLEQDISTIITGVVNHIKTQEFIDTAFYRMAKAHNTPIVKNPLENLDKIEKKPWAYTSGGTMGTLVSCYYKREQKPTEVGRWVENETELDVFLLDTLKQIPPKLSKEFDNPNFSMLMHSPTHAFLLKPSRWPFREGWQSDLYTYTWVRDNFVQPMKSFVDNQMLDSQMIETMISRLAICLPENYRHHFKNVFSALHTKMSPSDFRQYIIHSMSSDRGFRGSYLAPEEIDSMLFSNLPFFPSIQLRERLENIIEKLPGLATPQMNALKTLASDLTDSIPSEMLGAKDLKNAALALLALGSGKTSTPIDFQWQVSLAAQQLGYAMPTPLIFADTNWVKDEFGFVVNPGNEKLELWRLDYTGSVGMPMSSWKMWMDGSRKDITWGIYTRPYEYRG